ncbi:MAG: elongation factor 1-beta [Candidatus Bathyarchaeia archaeon]|nr:elongation factor 1-beta [Candidatus Bathyarchaeota archaeon]
MAKVLTSIKIFPSSPEVDLSKLKSEIKSKLPNEASIVKFDEEPIAFGLIALIVHITIPENKPEKINEVEDILKAIKDVSEIQILSSTRI